MNKLIPQRGLNPSHSSHIRPVSRDDFFLREIELIILENIGNETFSVTQLAAAAYLSTSQLNRRVKAVCGLTTGQLIRSVRMQHAADLLRKNIGSVSEIAQAVGYRNQANFCRSFKKWCGLPPSTYINPAK